MTTHAIRTELDFREVVVDYAREAAAHGAVYLEGIFTPGRAGPRPARRGTRCSPASATAPTRRRPRPA